MDREGARATRKRARGARCLRRRPSFNNQAGEILAQSELSIGKLMTARQPPGMSAYHIH